MQIKFLDGKGYPYLFIKFDKDYSENDLMLAMLV